jgi:hypothetical protein
MRVQRHDGKVVDWVMKGRRVKRDVCEYSDHGVEQ